MNQIDPAVSRVCLHFPIRGTGGELGKDMVPFTKGGWNKGLSKEGGVSHDTIFPIASNTKAFTAVSVGILVNRGLLGWDDLVRAHIPWYHLSDPLAHREVILRDLL